MSTGFADDEFNIKGLEKIIKALKTDPRARVGVLGNKAARASSDGSENNATIGARHEYGTAKLKQRSFLRMPISRELNKEMERSGLLDKTTLSEVVKEGTLVPWMRKVAILAEACVLRAFDTGGFGLWPPSDMTRKKNHQTLVETQQLRNSITWDVKE